MLYKRLALITCLVNVMFLQAQPYKNATSFNQNYISPKPSQSIDSVDVDSTISMGDTTDRDFNYDYKLFYPYTLIERMYVTEDLEPILLSESEREVYCIKTSTFRIISAYNKQYKVWIYIYPQKGFYNQYTQSLYKKYKSAKYLSFEVEKMLYYIDCDDEKIKLTNSISYTKTGDVIKHLEDENGEWETIIPETIGETILNYVCKLANKD